jgi:hypothetical protein
MLLDISLIMFGIGLGIHGGRALFLLGHAVGMLNSIQDGKENIQ